jgi:hypothetical protein
MELKVTANTGLYYISFPDPVNEEDAENLDDWLNRDRQIIKITERIFDENKELFEEIDFEIEEVEVVD